MTPAERFEELARAVGPDVLAYLARRATPREDAADLYQQVLVTTWRRFPVVPHDRREAFAWMLGVARRVLANHRRGAVRRSALTERLAEHLRTAVRDPQVDLSAELAALPADDAELLGLVHWEGLTLAEAAGVIGISAAAARKRMERARGRLRELLAGAPV